MDSDAIRLAAEVTRLHNMLEDAEARAVGEYRARVVRALDARANDLRSIQRGNFGGHIAELQWLAAAIESGRFASEDRRA